MYHAVLHCHGDWEACCFLHLVRPRFEEPPLLLRQASLNVLTH